MPRNGSAVPRSQGLRVAGPASCIAQQSVAVEKRPAEAERERRHKPKGHERCCPLPLSAVRDAYDHPPAEWQSPPVHDGRSMTVRSACMQCILGLGTPSGVRKELSKRKERHTPGLTVFIPPIGLLMGWLALPGRRACVAPFRAEAGCGKRGKMERAASVSFWHAGAVHETRAEARTSTRVMKKKTMNW